MHDVYTHIICSIDAYKVYVESTYLSLNTYVYICISRTLHRYVYVYINIFKRHNICYEYINVLTLYIVCTYDVFCKKFLTFQVNKDKVQQSQGKIPSGNVQERMYKILYNVH